MRSINSIVQQLSGKYATKGMDIKSALEVWRNENLSPEQIVEQINFDIKEKIAIEDAHVIYKIARNNEIVKAEYELYNKLASASRIKLTPAIKSALEKVDHNTFRIKTAGIEIDWSIEIKDGIPWLKRIYKKNDSPREEESLKQSNSHTRIKHATVEENEPWEVFYWNSGLADRFLEEYPGTLPEELRCIFKDLEGLQQGCIREADFLLRVLDAAEEHKDLIKSLRVKAEEEFNKRKDLREQYEKGNKPEYYRGASDNSISKTAQEEERFIQDDEEDFDLDLLD